MPKRRRNVKAPHAVDFPGIAGICAELAGRQKGLVTRAQLEAAGVEPTAISRAARSGFLHRRHRGVYSVGHTAMAPFATEQAALLASGPRAVLSGHSALYLWGLVPKPPPEVEITMIGSSSRSQPGIRVRRVEQMPPRDLRQRHGLPVTSPARTLIDLTRDAQAGDLDRLIADARIKRLIRPGELERAVARAGRRPGKARLRALLAAEGAPGLTRSEAERILLRLIRHAGLPAPLTNFKLGHYEADFLWPAERVIVEVDSWSYHGHRRAFEADRRKGLALEAAGYHVIRISARQLEAEPLAVIALLARALERAARALEPAASAHHRPPRTHG